MSNDDDTTYTATVTIPRTEMMLVQELIRSTDLLTEDVELSESEQVQDFLDRCPVCGDRECSRELTFRDDELVHKQVPPVQVDHGP